MIKTYKYKFADLNILVEDIGILIGYESGKIPEPFPGLIKNGLKMAPSLCNIRGGYQIITDTKINHPKSTIRIDKVFFHPGKIVTSRLKEATSAALFICTAGKEISEYAKKLSNEDMPMEAYILDVIGSVAVEKAIDKIEAELQKEMKIAGTNISDRFSPGYCHWNVDEQQKLFSLIPENFCGVTLSSTSLMNPVKSVSGIIGIGKEMKQKGYQCRWCSDKDCIYGKIKRNAATK